MVQQIVFRDNANATVNGGLLLDDGSIICGCCGGVFTADDIADGSWDITILKFVSGWYDISDIILSGEGSLR